MMKQVLLGLVKATGLFALAEWLTRNELRILAYHGIWYSEGHFGNFLFMKPDTFAARMQMLQSWGANVLSLEEGLQRTKEGSLPRRAVVITIDDGWVGTSTEMSPVLASHGYPATLYVSTYYVEAQRPVFDVVLSYLCSLADSRNIVLSYDIGGEEATQSGLLAYGRSLATDSDRQLLLRDLAQQLSLDFEALIGDRQFHLSNLKQLTAMEACAIDLQLHTHRHRMRYHDESCVADEIEDNRNCLNRVSVRNRTHFCYPSGEYSKSDWPALEALGIESATTTDIGLVNNRSEKYALPRILDGENLTTLELEAELSGFMSLVRRLIVRKRHEV